MGLSQLQPRILEQSSLNAFNSKLNGENSTVLFTYNKFDPADFPCRWSGMGSGVNKEVEFRDADTGELLVTAASINAAGLVLGKSRERIRLYLNNVKSIYSPNLKRFVRVNSVGNTELVTAPIDVKNPSIYVLRKEISKIDLNSLDVNTLYAFFCPAARFQHDLWKI